MSVFLAETGAPNFVGPVEVWRYDSGIVLLKQLLYFSPVPWHGLEQRPHRFVRWFHGRTGGRVLWVEPYPVRLPRISDVRRPFPGPAERMPFPDWMDVLSPRALPIEPIPGVGLVNHVFWRSLKERIVSFLGSGPCLVGVGKPSSLASHILRAVKKRNRFLAADFVSSPPKIPGGSELEAGGTCSTGASNYGGEFGWGGIVTFYDAMDNFPHFFSGLSRYSMSQREKEIVALVDMVFAPTEELVRRFIPHVPQVALVPNACDPDDLPRVEDLPPAKTRRGFVYTGTMARWFDWSLITVLATSFPSDPVELIGPLYHRPRGKLPSNVKIRPPLSSKQAMVSASHFAVGIIPFVLNDLTNAVDPIKYYEYVALGLPVLATPFGGMGAHKGKPGVFLAKDPAEWASQAQGAMMFNMGQDPAPFRKENSWEARFDASGLLSGL